MSDHERPKIDRRAILVGTTSITAAGLMRAAEAQAQAPATPSGASGVSRPNILLIMADDIGWFNISAFNNGIMGYRTPNIDRIAREGALFTAEHAQRHGGPDHRS